ncbi:hypothetical protein [Fusobacterium sp.]|uniref:hypothetical protein n=1 Tax=Fusobacterium sp. TaxID=68766 RepID=UPI00396C8793
MKKLISGIFIIGSLTAMAGQLRDGVYRGVFVSGQETQVEVQFNLKDDTIVSPKYRTLFYKGQDYLKNDELKDQKSKFEAALASTEGKKVDAALESLYTPENIPKAGASVRASKVRAAIQNAINNGVYQPEK